MKSDNKTNQNNQNNQNNQSNQSINQKKLRMGLSIGLASGIIWGAISLAAYYLQFTDIGPSIYAKPLLNPDYVLKWQGHLIGLLFYIFFSIIVSLIYAFLLSRFNSPWVGIFYGAALWGFVFIVLNPLFNLTKKITELGINTISVMLCIYILAGLFIGYSLSVEFNNEDMEK